MAEFKRFPSLAGDDHRTNAKSMPRHSLLQIGVVEAIGTFFLLFTIGSPTATPLAVGSALMVMVYAGGHLSGAHYNPAVTVAVLLTKSDALSAPKLVEGLVYVVAQLLGAVGGVLAADSLTADSPSSFTAREGATTTQILGAEFVATFALCYVVLQTAVQKENGAKSFYGLAIGFTVAAMAYAVGPVSGGAFNPAVATAFALIDDRFSATLWHYWVGPTLGGLAAAGVYLLLGQR